MAEPTWSSPSTRGRRAPGRSSSTARGPWSAVAQREFEQRYPSPGDVRHDPEAIWAAQLATAREAIDAAGGVDRIAAIGVTNQRETAVVWDRASGSPRGGRDRLAEPGHRAVLRGAARRAGHETLVRSAPVSRSTPTSPDRRSARSSIENPGLRPRADRGELAAGTVESFLVWRLTGGRAHVTDVSNASRTLLLDIRRAARGTTTSSR